MESKKSEGGIMPYLEILGKSGFRLTKSEAEACIFSLPSLLRYPFHAARIGMAFRSKTGEA